MTTGQKVILWAPRILAVAFILFLSLFALDVFSEYEGWDTLVPLLMHLIPSLVLAAIVLIAWRREWVGAVAFLGFAVLYVIDQGFDRPWSWYAGIPAPAAILGILYLTSWIQRHRRPALQG